MWQWCLRSAAGRPAGVAPWRLATTFPIPHMTRAVFKKFPFHWSTKVVVHLVSTTSSLNYKWCCCVQISKDIHQPEHGSRSSRIFSFIQALGVYLDQWALNVYSSLITFLKSHHSLDSWKNWYINRVERLGSLHRNLGFAAH